MVDLHGTMCVQSFSILLSSMVIGNGYEISSFKFVLMGRESHFNFLYSTIFGMLY